MTLYVSSKYISPITLLSYVVVNKIKNNIEYVFIINLTEIKKIEKLTGIYVGAKSSATIEKKY